MWKDYKEILGDIIGAICVVALPFILYFILWAFSV
tara:strand:+ start:574 stop:678 length:105 start_codon:yes stop_codon:yes gene_type:complete